ncbi:tail assembly chaperone [Sharpea azabuensis]|uniref:tail assembly chaperone n=1 Tax=Sharpea azabuensis TaxID=322505 RepID=UPI00240A3A41|nr:tail assembly chaperone [Sharpea azabuensis]MDD6512779.1 tail assembly chaperone [Sharpea azabuensis]
MAVMELTIGNQVYEFKAGIGFMREANKRVVEKIDNTDTYRGVGLTYLVAGIIDGDIDDLVDALDLMNKGMKPRVTRAQLDEYVEDVEDIDKLFEDVLDFFANANVSKRIVKNLTERIKKAQEAEQAKGK